jgi:hypothetical protein
MAQFLCPKFYEGFVFLEAAWAKLCTAKVLKTGGVNETLKGGVGVLNIHPFSSAPPPTLHPTLSARLGALTPPRHRPNALSGSYLHIH